MKKALFTLLFVVATCSVAMAQHNGSRAIATLDTVACESFVWSANGQTYTHDTIVTYTNAADDTLFVLNLTIVHAYTDSQVLAQQGCSYNWHGQTLTQSGNYTDTVTMPNGCDSIFTLTLTLSGIEKDSSATHACGEHIWHGDTLSVSGIYGDTTVLSATCTRIELINLTITNTLNRYDTVANCGRYTWFDSTYTVDGNYMHTVQDTAINCDTIFHLNLNIVTRDMDTVADSACNSKTWRGQVYTSTGIYTAFDTNATTGCVTRHILDLKVKPFRTPVKDTAMIGCNSIRFTVSSIVGSTTRIFTQSTVFDTNIYNRNWNQCYDSTIHLTATIKYSSSSDTIAVACDSFYWDRNKRTYYTNTEAKFTLADTNATGCDSVRVLKLTVKKAPVITAINGDWRLEAGQTARLYPTATAGSTYQWTTTPNVPTTTDGDTLIIANVQGNIDVSLMATINYSTENIACHDTSWITIVTYVGIDGAATPAVALYPNPTVGQLNIECATDIRQVTIYNTLGQQVALRTDLGNKNLLNVSELGRGTYTMRVDLANGESLVRKFVITK